MPLRETIDNDIKDAMRSKDQVALRALRAIKSAILLGETAEGRTPGPLNKEEEMKILQKQAKQRKDSIEQFQKAGREDLAKGEIEELEIIEKFLPKAMSPDEIEAVVKNIIASNGASGMKDMGKVMSESSKALAGKADGKVISEIVKRLLA